MSVKKILLVDDSPAQLIDLHDAVSSIDVQIVTATNGSEAIAKAKAEKPDIIFMDIVMDGLDGFGACREITRDEETKNIPVIFVTSKNQRADKIWADKQGCKAMISKPYQPQQILDQIKLHA
jgi:twitching motility two-component system response regulator PilH